MAKRENIKLGTKALATIIRQSPNGVIVTDDELTILFFNRSAERLTRVKKNLAVGANLNEIVPQANIDGDKNIKVDINGKEIHLKKFSIIEGEETLTVLLLQDLSNIVKLALELERTKHLADDLAAILEGSFDGVLVTDGEGNVLMLNPSYERVTGLTKEELIGNNMRDMLNPKYMKNSVALLAIEKRSPISLQHTTKNGRNIIVTGTPIINERGDVTKVVLNARDISEIYELQQELIKAKEMEKIYRKQLLESTEGSKDSNGLVIASEAMKNVFSLAKKVSSFNTTVMILGESGVGKEEIAKYIHNNDEIRKGPFVTVNCSAIPENLLESELFGYTKGAFTGANSEGKEGLFEAADGGTLLLDEIGELPLNLQVKLLRVLETREITRVGSTVPVPINVRILVATNKDLEVEVKNKTFREDLYYRLNVIQIRIPPLRERVDDIAPLVMSFVKKYNSQYGQSKKPTYDVIQEMMRYSWPGNIRELKNTVERMMIISSDEYMQIIDLPWFQNENNVNYSSADETISLTEAVEDFESKLLKEAVRKYPSTRKVAAALNIDQATVVRKMKKYGIERESEN